MWAEIIFYNFFSFQSVKSFHSTRDLFRQLVCWIYNEERLLFLSNHLSIINWPMTREIVFFPISCPSCIDQRQERLLILTNSLWSLIDQWGEIVFFQSPIYHKLTKTGRVCLFLLIHLSTWIDQWGVRLIIFVKSPAHHDQIKYLSIINCPTNGEGSSVSANSEKFTNMFPAKIYIFLK